MKFPLVLGAALSLLVASAAHAEAAAPASVKYFDENGNIVGQSIGDCANYRWHAGNTHTAYYIVEQVLCKIDPNPATAPRPLNYIVPGTEITSYILPSFLTIEQACAIAECEEAGKPVIDRLMDKGWTWKSGAY